MKTTCHCWRFSTTENKSTIFRKTDNRTMQIFNGGTNINQNQVFCDQNRGQRCIFMILKNKIQKIFKGLLFTLFINVCSFFGLCKHKTKKENTFIKLLLVLAPPFLLLFVRRTLYNRKINNCFRVYSFIFWVNSNKGVNYTKQASGSI